ncbi:hypothetical protein PG997_005344 [Apiospora hydei]|uniref:Uncharacterized protein n=1 Tax=Apiospora hydei TaxID=1337664 RepID=A0ABR1X4N8_9PEZI
MSGSTGSSKGRKRLGLEGSPGDRLSKHLRASKHVFYLDSDEDEPRTADKRHKDACASQTFVTGDNRFVTDSIPNHVRRHNGEIAQQGNTLQAILNAHQGFEKQLHQCDGQLAETKNSIQEVETNVIKKALGEVARVDDRITQEIVNCKDSLQIQLDAVNRKTTQHTTKVHQTLAAMAKCLQELDHMAEQGVGGDQPAAVQGVQVEANSDDIRYRP